MGVIARGKDGAGEASASSSGPIEYAIVVDQWITRRKKYHFVVDRNGAQLFHDTYVGGCISFLARNSVERAYLTGSAHSADWPGCPVIIIERY